LKMAPLDVHNQALLDKVHPFKHVNPKPAPMYNLVVVGAGAGGLVTAAQAAKRGAKVALIEKELLGGDCLNIGCVPSKALLACAKHAHMATHSHCKSYGINIKGGDASTSVDFSHVMTRMRKLRAEIASNDSVKRFQGLGVDVFIGCGKFVGPHKVTVNSKIELNCKKACIATGASAFVPPIPGLADVPYRTNQTIFNLTSLPKVRVGVGAGPIGCEMAQAFRRFGSEVHVLEAMPQPLAREDPDAAALLLAALKADGIRFQSGIKFDAIEKTDGGRICCRFTNDGGSHSIACDELLVATGRRANVNGVGLEAAGVKFTRHGVTIDDCLATSNPDIFAVGDVCLREKFTHMAGETGLMVCQNALFGGKETFSSRTIPWVTYTQPEIAHVGCYERDLEGSKFHTFTLKSDHFDRCITDGCGPGFVRIHTRRDTDEILGATIVGDQAGEMISLFTLAMHAKIGAKKVSQMIAPYPTQSETSKYTCNQYNIRSWGGWDGLKKTHTPAMKAALL